MNIKNLLTLTACLMFLSFTTISAPAKNQEAKPQKSWQASREFSDAAARRHPDTIYHERKVPEYTLPNPLIMANGTKVISTKMWQTKRRPEILELFRKVTF